MFKLSDYFVFREEAGEENNTAASWKTYTEAEVNELVAGLKANNDKLLTEKKESTRKASEEAAARLAAQQEAAKKNGELETFEKTLRGEYVPQLEAKDAKIGKMSERILNVERKGVMSDVVIKGGFENGSDEILRQYINVEFDGDDVAYKFVGADGNVITTDTDKFVEWCGKHPVLSKLMAATASTGGGAGGNKSHNGGAGGVDPTLTGVDKARAEAKAKLEKKYK